MDPGVLEILCEETGLVGVCIILLGLWKEKKDSIIIHVQSPSDKRQLSLPLGLAESYSFLKMSIANSVKFCPTRHAEVLCSSTNIPISSEYQ